TVDATFSGRDGVTGSTTTQQLTITAATTTTPKPTTKPPAPDAIMGGQRYTTHLPHEEMSSFCSFGFNGTDDDDHAVAITAGHCDRRRDEAGGFGATWVREGSDGDGDYLGKFDKTVVNGTDYSVIKIDDSVAKRFENNFVDTHGGDPLAITGTADPVVGAPVCKSGTMTGFTCGKITAINQYVTGANFSGAVIVTLRDSFVSTLCVIPGDSGGSIVTGTKALGITSSGNGGACNSSSHTWGQPINAILAANPGLKIRTN
ncbi:S1 family peptidase, partial [Rhodococcus maanshanensis]